MTLAIDASTPAYATHDDAGGANPALASTSFSPPAGSLIVCVAASATGGGTQSANTITDSLGTHLNWTSRASALGTDGSNTWGCASIWVADCPSAQTNMTVTVTFNQAAVYSQAVGVIVLTGAAPVAGQTGGTATVTNTN